MSVWQRESRLPGMIEPRIVPLRHVMAAVALRAESAFVNVITRMTGVAGTAAQARVIRLIVTIGAGETAMTQGQRKSGYSKMIKVDRRP